MNEQIGNVAMLSSDRTGKQYIHNFFSTAVAVFFFVFANSVIVACHLEQKLLPKFGI